MHPAAANIVVEKVAGKTAVTTLRSAGPLRLLAPDAQGDAAWVYQSSLGGGFVTTDALALDASVGPGAALFLSSQAASKVYRTADARFTLRAEVGAGATLIAWPDPTACFADAALVQHQTFALADATSRLVVVDAYTSGRSNERWAFARLESTIRVTRAGAPLLDEATLVDRAHGPLAARMGGATGAYATIVIVDPDPPAHGSPVEGGRVVRIAAPSAEQLHARVSEVLRAHVLARIGADPWTRKW